MSKGIKVLAWMLALALLAGGCQREPVITGSSEDAFKSSYEILGQGLSSEQKEELDKAVERLVKHHTARMKGKIRNPSEIRAYALMQLDGLTQKEILRKSAEIP